MQPTIQRSEFHTVRGDIDLHCVVWGPESNRERTPFLLVHGLASNARLWDGVARHLTELGHTVVAVDQRGHGSSSKPDTGFDMATVADDLALLIGSLGFNRPVVAGQSWGANVVIELAHRSPESVRGVVAVDGGDAARLIVAADLHEGPEAAMALAGVLMRAVWVDDLHIGDEAVLAAALAECGLPARRLEDAHSQAVHLRYEAATQAAVDAGVFGAPSYVVDGEIFWGQDRLDFLERRLRGGPRQG